MHIQEEIICVHTLDSPTSSPSFLAKGFQLMGSGEDQKPLVREDASLLTFKNLEKAVLCCEEIHT